MKIELAAFCVRQGGIVGMANLAGSVAVFKHMPWTRLGNWLAA